MKQKPYWIKERSNPQTGTYYIPCGQLTRTQARRHEKPLYGENIMHEYRSHADYLAKLRELKDRGARVHAELRIPVSDTP